MRVPRLRPVLSAGQWLPVLRHLPGPAGAAVGLSFDDGPHPQTTPALLALLRQHGAQATFFLTGERVAAAPGLAACVVEAGHAVFAHGWRHVAYAGEAPGVMAAEMERTEALLRRLRPTPAPYLVRLPYMSGRRDVAMHRAIRAWRADAQLAFWRFGLEDHRLAEGCADAAALERRCAAAAAALLRRRLPGAVLLLHEAPYDVGAPPGQAVAPVLTRLVLEGLACRGLRGVALQPMLRPAAITRFLLPLP